MLIDKLIWEKNKLQNKTKYKKQIISRLNLIIC